VHEQRAVALALQEVAVAEGLKKKAQKKSSKMLSVVIGVWRTEEDEFVKFIGDALWTDDEGPGGDDRNSEKSSSSKFTATWLDEETVCEGLCDPGGGGSGDITPVDLDISGSLPSH